MNCFINRIMICLCFPLAFLIVSDSASAAKSEKIRDYISCEFQPITSVDKEGRNWSDGEKYFIFFKMKTQNISYDNIVDIVDPLGIMKGADSFDRSLSGSSRIETTSLYRKGSNGKILSMLSGSIFRSASIGTYETGNYVLLATGNCVMSWELGKMAEEVYSGSRTR